MTRKNHVLDSFFHLGEGRGTFLGSVVDGPSLKSVKRMATSTLIPVGRARVMSGASTIGAASRNELFCSNYSDVRTKIWIACTIKRLLDAGPSM